MITAESLHPSEIIIFGRDCDATQIPQGNQVLIPKGSEAHVGQTLGGNVTLQLPSFGLVQIANRRLEQSPEYGWLLPHPANVRRITRSSGAVARTGR